MQKNTEEKKGWHMLEMEIGITTSRGNWYRITRDGINKYVPGLLEEISLEKIIRTADIWLESGNGLALVLFFILSLSGTDPYLSGAIALMFYQICYWNVSLFSFLFLTPLVRLLNNDGILYVSQGLVLAYFSYSSMFTAFWVGVVIFLLLKVRILGLLTDWFADKFIKIKLPRTDRLLNMILIRYGMSEGKLTGDMQRMEDDLIRIANYHRKGKSEKK
ncbi:hypothetical protein AB2B38_011400 [Balneola sp. MJW-20]|uniref:hypothetical protein n=1 Tax=Gracilimonas aurantiaca TaxID=3234185 RepID=UPI003466FCE1